jgi:MOSC domain-containing protein YiiM
MAHVFQVNLSKGGVPKTGLHHSVIGDQGLEGDQHRSPSHGGPQRALCLYSLERILALQAEGHPVFPGATGENLTLCGLDWGSITPGTRLLVGSAVEIEVTQYTAPCAKIAGSFREGAIQRMSQDEHPGWARVYAKVLRGGPVRAGDTVVVAGR